MQLASLPTKETLMGNVNEYRTALVKNLIKESFGKRKKSN